MKKNVYTISQFLNEKVKAFILIPRWLAIPLIAVIAFPGSLMSIVYFIINTVSIGTFWYLCKKFKLNIIFKILIFVSLWFLVMWFVDKSHLILLK